MTGAIEHLYSELRRERSDVVYRLLLDHGTAFKPAQVPPGLPAPEPRSCYLNAYRIAASAPDRYDYFEGVGVTWFYDGKDATEMSLSGPFAHAWCVDRAGEVVDTSWGALTNAQPAAYVGVRMPVGLVEPFAVVGSEGTFRGLGYDLRVVRDRLGLPAGQQS